MRSLISAIVLCLCASLSPTFAGAPSVPPSAGDATAARLKAFSAQKFGLFIHWGLYSQIAGEWRGVPLRHISSWIMYDFKIPAQDYAAVAAQFNPTQYDPEGWAQLAKDAGMKYMVITAKHHEGFSMFATQASPYNIVEATPFARDPMPALAKAAADRGLGFGFYYSQAQDWHEPNGAGNTWDFPEKKDSEVYFAGKVLPQVAELLTHYGPLELIWFDTPQLLTAAQVRRLRQLVKDKQPECLVNARIGHGQGDYEQMSDNAIPILVYDKNVWEVPATLNDTWGFKKHDHHWKQPDELVYKLADVASKGGNYLLNIGPDGRGVVPEPSRQALLAVGRWLQANGESIYGTTHTPLFMADPAWRCTAKPGRLYLHVFDLMDGDPVIRGLSSKITRATLLRDGAPVEFTQEGGQTTLHLSPTQLDPLDTVVALELADTQAQVTPPWRYNDLQPRYVLWSRDARFRGVDLEYLPRERAVSHFLSSDEMPFNGLWWYFYPPKGGGSRYKASIEYACDDADAGGSFQLCWEYEDAAGDTVKQPGYAHRIAGTGGRFQTFELGALTLNEDHYNLIKFGTNNDGKSAGVRVRRLILERETEVPATP